MDLSFERAPRPTRNPNGKAPVKEPFLTPANVLTLSRLPLGVLAWVVPAKPLPFLTLMAAAGVTDLLDGWAARHRRRRLGIASSESAGVWLDPLCDKAFVVLMLSAMGARRRAAPELLAAIASREVLIAPLAVVYRLTRALRRRGHRDFKAAKIGKLTTVAQFLAMVATLVDTRRARPLALAAGGLGVISAGYYLRRAALAEPIVEAAPPRRVAPRTQAIKRTPPTRHLEP